MTLRDIQDFASDDNVSVNDGDIHDFANIAENDDKNFNVTVGGTQDFTVFAEDYMMFSWA